MFAFAMSFAISALLLLLKKAWLFLFARTF